MISRNGDPSPTLVILISDQYFADSGTKYSVNWNNYRQTKNKILQLQIYFWIIVAAYAEYSFNMFKISLFLYCFLYKLYVLVTPSLIIVDIILQT